MGDTNENYLTYIKETYQELTQLNHNKSYRTLLVRRNTDGSILVRKEVPLAQGGVYQQMRGIRHPNLVQVHQVFYEQERCVVLEDYISGRSLKDILEERRCLPVEDVMDYMFQLLDGLEVVHRYHIIHRDIKPENILISLDGVAKLLDFGIARFTKEDQLKDTAVLGTVGYASPEQFGFQQTDMRTDIYAMGILMNNMLTGAMPDEIQVSNPKLKRIIDKCMEIDPRNRFPTVAVLRQELKRAIGETTYVKAIRRRLVWREQARMPVEEQNQVFVDDQTWLPGFRTGFMWKKVLACIGYAIFLITTMVYIMEAVAGGGRTVVLEAIAMFFYMWFPVISGSNLGRWDRKLPIVRRLPKELKIMLRVALCVISAYAGLYLHNYVRHNLLGLLD